MNTTRSSGFSLAEIAIALMVTSVALLVIFSLLPAGIQMNKAALDETQAALFADQVINGVRAQASTTRWDRIKGGIRIPPPTPDVWANVNELYITETANPSQDYFETLRYKTKGSLLGGTEPYVDFGIRYRLDVFDVNGSTKGVVLKIRPGEYGTTNTYAFYTELYNHGQQ